MENLYFKLAAGQTSFRDDILNITLSTSSPYGLTDLSNITPNINESLNAGLIVQIGQDEYNSGTGTTSSTTSTPIIEETADLSPYIYTKTKSNSLPTPIDQTVYYLLGDSPASPFNTYKNYLLKFDGTTFHLYKPKNNNQAIVAISPNSIYYKYFGTWPTGKWLYYINDVYQSGADNSNVVGMDMVVKVGEVYSTFDLSTTGKIPVGKEIDTLVITREGSPVIEGDIVNGYTLSGTIVSFVIPITINDRVIYQFTLKNISATS